MITFLELKYKEFDYLVVLPTGQGLIHKEEVIRMSLIYIIIAIKYNT